MSLTRHRRIPYPSPIKGKWRLDCSCGWRAEVPVEVGRDEPLQRLFLAHIPAVEHRTYVLVDQREYERDADDNIVVYGNFVMPEGVPCRFERHWEEDGLHFVDVLDPPLGKMPLGEIRLRDGRVFRTE